MLTTELNETDSCPYILISNSHCPTQCNSMIDLYHLGLSGGVNWLLRLAWGLKSGPIASAAHDTNILLCHLHRAASNCFCLTEKANIHCHRRECNKLLLHTASVLCLKLRVCFSRHFSFSTNFPILTFISYSKFFLTFMSIKLCFLVLLKCNFTLCCCRGTDEHVN